jgi:uncharacterized protein (TIGR03437 family)
MAAAAFPALSQTWSGQYAVILKDAPVAQHFIAKEAMSTPAADTYRRQIAAAQDALRAEMTARNIQVVTSVDTVLNAVFVAATPDRVPELKALPGVLDVVPMRMVKALLNRATALMNAPAAWSALGGQSKAGAGIKVGVMDYGIDQTHPAFQDPSLSMPAGFPKCTDGHPEDCAYTNSKVIVARSYVRLIAPGSNPSSPAADSRPDDFSPRDHEGHGTAVASIIAANTAAGSVTITGMAPKAWLGNYKVFGSPNINDAAPESVFIKALNDAVNDGMDVINFSAGITEQTGPLDTGAACGLAAGTPCDPLASAFEAAASKAVIVVAAGNSGYDGNNSPTFGSIGSPGSAPSVIAAGAITNSHFFTPTVSAPGAPANLQNLAGQPGDDPYSPLGAYTYPVRDVTALGDDGYACNSLPANSLSGTFALIQRSVVGAANACSFASKVDNAYNAGAAGVILYMSDSTAPVVPGFLDNNGIPVVMISQSDGQNLKAYVGANPGAAATIDPNGAEADDTVDANELSFYSSLGPNMFNPTDTTGANAAIKPDLVAVGTGVYMAAQNYDPDGGQFSTTRFAAADGTSFASPMTAGAAALVKQAHPTWTPAQIKSALVNTTNQGITTDDSGDLIDVQWIGAGKLDAGAAVATTVVASPVSLSWGVLAAAPSNVSKALTISNLGTASVTLTVAVAPGAASSTANLSGNGGINPTVDKSSITVPGGGSAVVNVSLNGSLPKAGSYTGAVTLKGTGASLTVPYIYFVGGGSSANYNLMFAASGGFEGIVGQQPYDPLNPARPQSIAFKLTDGSGLPVSGASVTWTARPRNAVTFANSSSTTNAYGFASTDITINQGGDISVVASAGGQSFTFGGYGWPQPVISAGGVVNDATFAAPIAPGSYIAIFGSNLSYYTDSTIYTILPLSLDGVSVSFDVPSAGLSYPGRLVFVSPGQVNVQVPWELQGQSSAQVKITINSYVFGSVVTVPLADAAPGFFEVSSGMAAALDANYKVVTTANPVKRGQLVQLYLNGLGPVTNQPNSGEPAGASPLAQTKTTPVVMIGGQQAQVSFAGLAPGFPGLYQINATVPAGINVGTATITVAVGGTVSKGSGLPVN